MNTFGKLLRPFFGVSQEEATSFSPGDERAALRLETVISTVTKGCQLTLQNSRSEVLVPRLEAFDAEIRGFAYEGAGTGLAAMDCAFPWRDRTKAFLEGPGGPYTYAVHIGAGLALARLRRRPEPFLRRLDPVMCWMAIDGYGFHEGFFARRRFVQGQQVPGHLSAYGRRTFDHGLGRAIWFLSGGNIDEVAATIGGFAAGRQRDLWSGIGLACGYTGGVSRTAIEALREQAGPHAAQLGVGTAIAANARLRAHSPGPYADLACEVLCGTSCAQASAIVERAFVGLPLGGAEPAYAIWRQRIASQLETGLLA
ncbi:DUF1702 family protein [Chloroflexia bacterium SDU3-3]|nr:DUF1702 family protein [Chloroflexia bacterium SDU3-3]